MIGFACRILKHFRRLSSTPALTKFPPALLPIGWIFHVCDHSIVVLEIGRLQSLAMLIPCTKLSRTSIREPGDQSRVDDYTVKIEHSFFPWSMLTIIEDGKLCGTLRSSQQAFVWKEAS